MSVSRLRRIARRAVFVLAAVLLPPVGYVGSAVSLTFADSAGWLPGWCRDVLVPIYAPLNWYITANCPGADVLVSFADAAIRAGERVAGR